MTLPQMVSKSLLCPLLGALLLSVALGVPAAASSSLSLNPASLHFGEVLLGSSESLAAVLTNSGSSKITISSVGASPSAYKVSYPALPLSLSPGQSASLTVTFVPSSTGTVNGSVSVNGSAMFAVSGWASSSKAVVPNPPSIAFGNVQSGRSVSTTVTITNQKSGNVNLSSASTRGSGFSMSGLPTPLTLSPGQSYTFKIAFSPTAAGAVTGSFQAYNARNSAIVSIPLTGTGTASGQLTLSPSSASFGSVTVGSSVSKSGSLSANGASVTISSASSSSSEFVLSGISLPKTLAAGQSATYSVTFTPQSSGTANGTVLFSSVSGSASEAVSGTGVAAAPQYSVDLTWNASTSPVNGYNVYRGSKSGGPYAKINSSLNPSTTYTDKNVTTSTTYYYVTTAVNSSGQESGYSNQVQVSVP